MDHNIGGDAFADVRFDGDFRPYQSEVLAHADEYLQDKKIHIVAAPGAGKTVLGLELIRRLGRPALILSPTVTIRSQWVQRFCERFLPENADRAAYVSEDICAPGLAVSLLSASGREQQIFIRAMRTMLSPVDDPVYLIVKSGVGKFGSCFACPDVFKNADEVRSCCSHLRKKGWKAEYMYTRTEKGRKALILARKRSFLNVNDAGVLTGRKKISPRFK